MAPTESQYSESKQQDSAGLIREEQSNLKPFLQDASALHSIKSTCWLSRLPVELFDMVLENLDFEEVFILGIQTQHFWKVARRHLQAYVASCIRGPWAGEGIICMGDYSEPKDLPPNVLAEVERVGSLKGMRKIGPLGDDSADEDFDPDSTNLYHLAEVWYPEVECPRDFLPSGLIAPLIHLQEWQRLPDSFQDQILTELESYRLYNFYPPDQPWVLRNLTTQEYVRSEAIAIKPEHICGPEISGPGFGEVVLSRTSWSTDGNCGMENTRDIHRGVWAGHRFDITTLDRHRQGSLGQTEWKDVSEEVANEIDRLWTEGYGSDWRDHIRHAGFGRGPRTW